MGNGVCRIGRQQRRILDYALIKVGSWIHGFAVATRATPVGFSGENLGFMPMPDIAKATTVLFRCVLFLFVLFQIFISARETGFKASWTLTTAMKLFNIPYLNKWIID